MTKSLIGTAVDAARNPGRSRAALRSPGQNLWTMARRAVTRDKEYVYTEDNRSESDTGTYVALARKASQDYKAFSTFRRHPDYMIVLEHVTREQGQAYFDILRRDAPDLVDRIADFKANDLVGSPVTYDYDGVGQVSPTTLRYMKVASDLRKLFGPEPGGTVAEVGVGYGGQMLVNDIAFRMQRYDLFDLPPVLALVERYLESHMLQCYYRVLTLNQHSGEEAYDLVISNYAFSELPSQMERRYIEKVLGSAKRGYLTMNSGRPESVFSHNKLSLDELRELLPDFEVLPEEPSTHPGNYIIAWGHSGTVG